MDECRAERRKAKWDQMCSLVTICSFSVFLCAGGLAQAQQTNTSRSADAKLIQAVKSLDLDKLKEAIAEGASPNSLDTNGLSPLLQIICGASRPLTGAQRQCFAYLVERGTDLGACDADGRPPLIHAARAGDYETVRLLVDTGNVYVRTRDRFYMTALLYAAKAHNREIVLYLASNGDIQSPTVRERRERGRR